MDTYETTETGRFPSLLIGLARNLETLAATEAARTPYWAPYPDTVAGRRAAAAVLREEADRLSAAGAPA